MNVCERKGGNGMEWSGRVVRLARWRLGGGEGGGVCGVSELKKKVVVMVMGNSWRYVYV